VRRCGGVHLFLAESEGFDHVHLHALRGSQATDSGCGSVQTASKAHPARRASKETGWSARPQALGGVSGAMSPRRTAASLAAGPSGRRGE
jgi:hypothetical protein